METTTENGARRTSKPAGELHHNSQDSRGLDCVNVGAGHKNDHKASKRTRGSGMMQLLGRLRIHEKPAAQNVTITAPCTAQSSNDKTKGQYIRDTNSATNEVKECPPVVPEVQDESNLFIARFSYEARTSEDISCSKGEIFIINNTDGDWWYARSQKSGREGYVPHNYVAKCGSIDAEE